MHEMVVVDFVCNVRECIVSVLPFSWIAEVHYDEGIGFIRRKGVDKKKREMIGKKKITRKESKNLAKKEPTVNQRPTEGYVGNEEDWSTLPQKKMPSFSCRRNEIQFHTHSHFS